MKTILADDDVADTSRTGFFTQLGAGADWTKRLLDRCLAPRVATPWNRGYDAFYDIRATNPHPLDSAAYLEWEQGKNAAREDFEW